MEIDLFQKNFVPVVSASGLSLFGLDDLAKYDRNGYVLKSTGEHFVYLDQLKKACHFGVSGVLAAYSNAILHQQITLTIGRITRIQIPENLVGASLRLIAAPRAAAIVGDMAKDECVFPHYQHSDDNSINVTCCAFDACSTDFKPSYLSTFYLAIGSQDPPVQRLHESLWHFSQNDANRAAIFLFASVEAAISTITKNYSQSRISGKIHAHFKNNPNIPDGNLKILRKLKDTVENFAEIRGIVAHKGQHLTQQDLLLHYSNLVDLYAYYEKLAAGEAL